MNGTKHQKELSLFISAIIETIFQNVGVTEFQTILDSSINYCKCKNYTYETKIDKKTYFKENLYVILSEETDLSLNYRVNEELSQSIGRLTEKFNENFVDRYRVMCKDIKWSDDISEFEKIFEALFSERISWGRIIGMIYIIRIVVYELLTHNKFDLIGKYLNAATDYYQKFVLNWVQSKGGLESLVGFESQEISDVMRDLTQFSRVALATATAFGAMFVLKGLLHRI